MHRRVAWPVPDDIADDQAIALALQGQSAWHLLFTATKLQAGERVVIPAAAGGVGSLAVQLAKRAGATVIALASTEKKRQVARDLGADAVIDSAPDGLTDRIIEAAGGPVQVALEMTGGPVFQATLAALAPRGRLVVYGYASGDTAAATTHALMEKSLTVSGFWLPHLYSDRDALPTSMKALFQAVRDGDLTPVVGDIYPLSEASTAHSRLAARDHIGKLALDTSR